MDWNEIKNSKPDGSGQESWVFLYQLLHDHPDWIVYSEVTQQGSQESIDLMIKRFLLAHGKTKSFFGFETFAFRPEVILRCIGKEDLPKDNPLSQINLFGGVFSNGAVFEFENQTTSNKILFVSQETASIWEYNIEKSFKISSLRTMKEIFEEIENSVVE